MNYPKEINMFYDWLETNHLSKSAIALWNALMHVNSKTNWTESFEVAISTLEFKTGFKRSELFDARNVLTQKSRIQWKQRGGNLSATYFIIPFCVHNTDANTDTSTDASMDAKPTQKGTINNITNTKKNINIKNINNKNKVNNNNTPLWKTNFEIYLNELKIAYDEMISDEEFIKELEKFNPNLDILLTLEQTFNYWKTEEGWKKKKSSRKEGIAWKSTFNKTLKFNIVYKQRFFKPYEKPQKEYTPVIEVLQ